VRTLIIVLAVAGLLITAAAAGAGWEIHRLDQDVESLQAEVQAQQGSNPRVDAALRKLSGDTAKIKEGHLREEFYAPFYAAATQYRDAVSSGYSDCSAVREQWRSYVNTTVNGLASQRALRLALRHDDPDYHATLLNAFRC
jgi:hypothetical protein